MTVRSATNDDLADVAALLDYEIANNFAHFGTTPSDVGALAAAVASQARFPFVVALDSGQFQGFARLSRYKEREAYNWTAEIGVYVCPEARGKGVASALYGAILPLAEAAGIRTILAGIALPNPASVKLHESFGFEKDGVIRNVGFKFGRWIDVGLWTRHSGTGPPEGILSRDLP